MSALAVLTHRVCELCDSVAGRSQPFLNLREVEDDLPVSPSVQRWRLLRPGTRRNDLQTGRTVSAAVSEASSSVRPHPVLQPAWDHLSLCPIGAL